MDSELIKVFLLKCKFCSSVISTRGQSVNLCSTRESLFSTDFVTKNII